MVLDTADIIIKILSGGAVGYITNLFAIKILFKKYPLIGGGEIEHNYSRLEADLINVLEENLINQKTISHQLKSPEFKNTFNEFTYHLADQSLYNNIPDIEFKELPGYQDINDNLNKFFTENNSFIDNLDLKKILDKVDIKKLLENDDLKNLAKKIYPILSGIIMPEFKNMTLEIYDEIKEKKISDIFQDETLNKLKENFNPLLDEIKTKLKELEPEIDKVIKDFWQELNTGNIFDSLENNIKNKSINEIVGVENKDQIIKALINHFIFFINTSEGKDFLLKLSSSLLSMAKEVDTPLLNFLMPVLQVRIFNFLDLNIPYLADNAKEWLRINKKEIEQIIEESIEEYFTTQNLMGQLKLTVKDMIGLKISEYFKVVEKAIDKFESYIDENATKDITEQLVGFLENRKIGDIFTQLDLKDEALAEFFSNFINNYLPKIRSTLFDSFLNKKLGDMEGIFNVSLKDRFGSKIEQVITDKVKDFILSDYPITKIKEIIPEKFDSFKDAKLESVFSKEKLEGFIGYLPLLLMFSQGKIVDSLFNELNKTAENKKVSEFLNDDIQKNIKLQLTDFYNKNISKVTEKAGNIKIKSSYEKFKNSDSFIKGISNFYSPIFDNFEPLRKGRIAQIISMRSNKFSAEDLKDSIESFRKDQMQSVIWFGATVGAVSGFLLYLIQTSMNVTNNPSIFIINPIIYILIGITTNWLLVKMLFKPYHRKRILRMKIPFTPGLTVRRKEELSNNIGKFVANQLINEEVIKNTFYTSVDRKLKNYISKDNYQSIENIIDPNSLTVNQLIVDKGLGYALSSVDPESLSTNIADKIDQFSLGQINKDKFDSALDSTLNKGEEFFSNFIYKKIIEYKDKDFNSLPDKLKADTENLLKINIEKKVKETINNLKEIDIEEKTKTLLTQLEEIINLDIKLGFVYSPDENFKLQITEYLNSLIKAKIPEGVNKYIQKNFIEEELSPDKEISTLFNGELIPFVRKNIYVLLDTVIFGFGLDKLKDEKEAISQAIIKGVRESNKDNFFYGLGESIFSIDKDIKEIVHLIIDTKLGPYLKDKKSELEILLTGFVDFVSQKKLEEIGLNNDILNSENINKQVYKFINHQSISTSINHMSTALFDNVLSLDISYILKLIGINSLSEMPDKFMQEIKITRNAIFDSLDKNEENIQKIIDNIASEIINKTLFTQTLKPLFEDIDESLIRESINQLTKDIFDTKSFVSYKQKFSLAIYNSFADKKVGEFIDKSVIETHIAQIIKDLINDDQLKDDLKIILKPVVQKLITKINLIIPETSKEYIIEIMIKSIIESFTNKTTEIVKSININNIVVREINEMTSQQIEDLFNSIAEPYFNKFVLYGSLGGIIGILDAIITLSI